MERIDKGYAILYVDREGESLIINEDLSDNNMVSDYYSNGGPLQWNFYLIIAKEVVPIEREEEILNNETYTRKLIVPKDEIDNFIEERFPTVGNEVGKMTLIKGRNWSDALELFKKEKSLNGSSRSSFPSWNRNESTMDTLTKMDILRAELITNPKLNCIFYTHLSGEYNLAEKKFYLFTKKTEI